MARYKNAEATGLVISHWLSTRYAIDFLGIWERINNPHFNLTEFSNIRFEAGMDTNLFVSQYELFLPNKEELRKMVKAILS